LAAGCTGGTTVNLGAQAPRPFHFGAPRALTELGSTFSNDNPTLTADLLEIYFTSRRDDVGTDVWWAHRASTTEPFADVALVTAASSPSFETSSAIAPDGLTLWIGSDRPGGLGGIDIWALGRPARDAAWTEPVNLAALNSPMHDVPRPPGQHALVMPLASQRENPELYRTYLSARAANTAPFGPLQAIPALVFPTQSTVDAFLSDDGLALLFSSGTPAAAADLFVAWRRSTSDAFELYQALDELNTVTDDRDPWLSADGRTLFFSSDREHAGTLTIYEVSASRP
jgi:hypothetical protein